MSEFPIIEVRLTGDDVGADAPNFNADASEQVGSKEKFWCEQVDTHQKYLLKFARSNTGEDWAEKLASELARDIFGLPHARVDLASYRGRAAVLSAFFPGDGQRLIHGNELLLERDSSYPSREVRRVRKHTLAAVFDALGDVRCPEKLLLPPEVVSAQDLFCGYLVLDVLIGNTDRHHENWGFLVGRSEEGERVLTLAPTYDHGSSLGRELLEPDRDRRLHGADPRVSIAAYAQGARSAFYLNSEDARPLLLRDLLIAATDQRPAAVRAWASRLDTPEFTRDLRALVERVPGVRMSSKAREFAAGLLEYNRRTIQDVVKTT